MTMKFGPTHATIIIVAFFAALVALASMGKDTAALVAVGVAILGAIGLAVGQAGTTREAVNQVATNTNGNTHRLMQIIDEQSRLLAAAMPPSPESVASVNGSRPSAGPTPPVPIPVSGPPS